MMKNFYILFVFIWLGLNGENIIGHVIPQDPHFQLNSNLEMNNGRDNEGRWFKMVIQLAIDGSKSQSASLIDGTKRDICDDEINKSPCKCKDGFIQLDSKQCYYFSKEKKTWHEALAACVSMGTTLAHPMNPTENYALVNYIKCNLNQTKTGIYMGGSDEAKEGQWVWAHNKAPIVYTDWRTGQPDNFGHTEHCLHYTADHGWKWNDIPCTSLLTFICQNDI